MSLELYWRDEHRESKIFVPHFSVLVITLVQNLPNVFIWVEVRAVMISEFHYMLIVAKIIHDNDVIATSTVHIENVQIKNNNHAISQFIFNVSLLAN